MGFAAVPEFDLEFDLKFDRIPGEGCGWRNWVLASGWFPGSFVEWGGYGVGAPRGRGNLGVDKV